MKKFAIGVIALVCQSAGWCLAAEPLLPMRLGIGKVAYVEPSSGKVIGEGFDAAFAFSDDGLARIRRGKAFGFIDRTGQFIVEPAFDDATDFANGVAVVTTGKKHGLIGTNGKLLTAIEYDALSGLVEDAAYFQKGSDTGFMDRNGKVLFTFKRANVEEPVFSFREGFAPLRDHATGKSGFVDKTGAFVIAPQFKDAQQFSEGRALVTFADGTDGFIGRDGKTVFALPTGLTACGEFHEGLACVIQGEERPVRFGFIDTAGKLVIPCQFNDRSHFSCGLARVRCFVDAEKQKELWGYVDRTGAFAIKPTFVMASDFIKDHAVVSANWGDSRGLIDKHGDFVLKPEYASMERTFESCLILCKKGQAQERIVSFADPSGKILLAPHPKAGTK